MLRIRLMGTILPLNIDSSLVYQKEDTFLYCSNRAYSLG